MAEKRAAKEEEDRLQALEDAKNKKKPQKKKKGEEEEDPFAVDYAGIRKRYAEPVCEKLIKELLQQQGVKQEFFELFYKFVVEVQKQAAEQNVELVIVNEFTTVPMKDIVMAGSQKSTQENKEGED